MPLTLGTLEGGRLLALKAVGSNAVFGMAFGVAIRIAQLFWACFDLVNYALLAPRTAARPQPIDLNSLIGKAGESS